MASAGVTATPSRRRRLVLEAVAVLALSAVVAYVEGRPFWRSGWVNYGQGDWAVHAYRAAFLDAHGLTSWDPDWDAGLPLFQGYPILPHVLTLAVRSLLGTDIPHAMLALAGGLLVVFPAAGYVSLRGLGVGPLGALLGMALLFDDASAASTAGDFAYVFGLAALPVLVWVVVAALGRPAGWAGAVLLGLSPYLHPYALVGAFYVLVVRVAYDRGRVGWRFAAQAGIALAVSAFFWLPLLHTARPRFVDPILTTTFVEQILFAHDGVAGLSVATVALGVVTIAAVLARRHPAPRLAVCCVGGAALSGLIAFLGWHGWLPDAIMGTEPTRLPPVMGALTAMGCAPLGDAVPGIVDAAARRWRLTRLRGSLPAALAVCAAAALISVEASLWFHHWQTKYVPLSDAPTYGQGADLAAFATTLPVADRPAVMWTDPDDLGFSSFFSFGDYHFTGDYVTGLAWSQTSSVLDVAMLGRPLTTDPQAADRYLRMDGVRYLRISRALFGTALLDGPLAGRFHIVATYPDGWVVEVPWQPVSAFTAAPAAVRATTLPDVTYRTADEQALRTRLVDAYDAVAYGSSSAPATIAWRSPTALDVTADAAAGGMLVVAENWDTTWTATAGGRALPVERVGPDFLGVDLAGLTGHVTVTLEHGAYPLWTASLVLAGVAAAAAAGATAAEVRRARRRR
ncbi:MAG TPA: hypothetical protein VFO60_02035 [Candidatus Dormibacteraeota bacterium]|nr:hypothetical protein [Candidatus Dormibacteraeota bacterium]